MSDRRQQPRLTADLSVRLSAPGRRAGGRLRDLSAGGALVRLDTGRAAGWMAGSARVAAEIEGIGSLSAEVVACNRDHLHLRFLPMQAEGEARLCAWLGMGLAASPGAQLQPMPDRS